VAKSFKWLLICAAFAACHAPNSAYHVGAPTDGPTRGDALEHADRLADASITDVASEPSAPPPDVVTDLAPDLPPDLAADLAPEGPGTTLPTPVAYWRLDSAPGNATPDDLGRNGGRLINGATVTAMAAPLTFGNPGAVALAGNGDYVSLGVLGLPGLNSPKSVSVWFFTGEDVSSIQRKNIMTIENLTAGQSIHLGLEYGAVAVWRWTSASASIAAPTRATLQQWHHIGYTFNGQQHVLYLDGASVGSIGFDLNAVATTEVYLGLYHPTDGSSERFSGRIDDVRIYDRALTAAQIAALAAGRW
jgi:Concanavalin A-like lectin/glucanases superfamily